MPAFVTHDLFAKKLLQALPFQTNQKQQRAFAWGAQGPDVLFFQTDLSSLALLGRQMHREQVDTVLTAWRNYALAQDDEEITFYFCGLLSHYCLDTVLHPYVYALQRKLVQKGFSGGVHNRIESDIDTALYTHFTGKSLQNFSLNHLKGERMLYQKLARGWQQVILQVFGKKYSVARIEEVYYGSLFFFACFGKSALLRKSAQLVESKMGAPHSLSGNFHYEKTHDSVLNLSRKGWRHSDGEFCRDSVTDLLEKAADQWLDLIKTALAGQEMSHLLQKPYNYGKI